MKRFLYFFATIMTFMSCVENDMTFPEDSNVYYGELSVGDYTEMVGISVKEGLESTVEIFFDDVKFAAAMPVRIDITVKDVPCRNDGEILRFSAVNVDPYTNRETEPQPNYRFAVIEGTVVDNELTLDAKMADNLDGSRAGMEFRFRGVCKVK